MTNWLGYIGILMMPLTYGFVGWITNLLALKMTFYPLKFKGVLPPYLGWQGIVPRKSAPLALKAVQMLTTHLIKVEDFFARINPERLAGQLKPILETNVPRLTEELLRERAGDATLAPEIREQIAAKALAESTTRMEEIASHLKDDVGKVFNFKALVLRNLTGENVKLIVDILQEVGAREFKFIRLSGWYFGGALGTLQMVLWYFMPYWWTLPIQGVLVGFITNWLALTMIFRPLYEKRFGLIRYQGLFLKRQDEVSRKYASIFAAHVLSPRNIMEEILYRRIARAVVETIEKDIAEHLGTDSGSGSGNLESSRKAAATMIDSLSAASATMEKMIGRSMDVENMIYERMRELPPEEFEPILRSAFQEDEYVLIVIGSILGALVGLTQGLYMFAAM